MKRILLIAFFLIVWGGGVVFAQERAEWYITATEGGPRARNNQVTLSAGDNLLYIVVPKQEAGFERIRINFTIDKELDVTWMAIWQDDATLGSEEYIGKMNSGPIETDFASFNKPWYVGAWGKNTPDKTSIRTVILRVNNPSGRAVFTLTSVEFLR